MSTLQKRWLTVREAAIYISTSEGSLRNAMSKGAISYSKKRGLGVRLDRYRLDAMLEENMIQTVDEQVARIGI